MAEVGEKVFYVYAHFRADAYPYNPDADPCDPSGGIFYIGKGTVRPRSSGVERHRVECGRTAFWKRVVQRHGFVSVVLFETTDEGEAHLWERRFIALLGKRLENTGALVNLTDGGEGASGVIKSAETRARHSAALAGHRVLGVALERRRRATKLALGKPVVDTSTMEMWPSATDAAKARGLKPATMIARLSGKHVNPTSLSYVGKLFEVPTVQLPRARRSRPRTLDQRRRMSLIKTKSIGVPVVNVETGQVWPSQAAAAAAIGMNVSTLENQLKGRVKKYTPYRKLALVEKGLTDRTQ